MQTKIFTDKYEKIKLIIWDLDDTFWKGTISEEEVTPVNECIELLKRTVDKGIMNSICSKNDYDVADKKLQEWGIRDLFVFPSIDWTSKGVRVKNIIERMKLREENTLFIDDNETNLEEVKFICPEIMVLNADNIKNLCDFITKTNAYKDDSEHKRLAQYKILETKENESEKYNSNDEFLKQSNIRVYIDKACKDKNRIAELVQRSNQLNFTKNRAPLEEIEKDLLSNKYEAGAVYVKDNYGDYGMAGYYQLDKNTNNLKHFLFSCRTLGMGIEQFIYQYLKYPNLQVVGQVVNTVDTSKNIDWIKNVEYKEFFKDENNNKPKKDINKNLILFKGPCDLLAILPMISAGGGGIKAETEFSFVNKHGFTTYSFLHSVHILESEFLSKEQKQEIIDEVPFLIKEDFENKMFSPKYKMVFFSLLTDVHLGVYKHKTKGYRVAFNSRNFPLTDKKLWDKFINADNKDTFKFSKEILEKFSKDFEFEGALTTDKIIDNINKIRELMPKETILVLITGSEIDADNNNELFNNHAKFYVELNKAVAENYSNSPNIKIINPAKYITDQSCLNGCTNHYSKVVYHKIAMECCNLINSILGKGENLSNALSANSLLFLINTILIKTRRYSSINLLIRDIYNKKIKKMLNIK